jgi:hypothetical protein
MDEASEISINQLWARKIKKGSPTGLLDLQSRRKQLTTYEGNTGGRYRPNTANHAKPKPS